MSLDQGKATQLSLKFVCLGPGSWPATASRYVDDQVPGAGRVETPRDGHDAGPFPDFYLFIFNFLAVQEDQFSSWGDVLSSSQLLSAGHIIWGCYAANRIP